MTCASHHPCSDATRNRDFRKTQQKISLSIDVHFAVVASVQFDEFETSRTGAVYFAHSGGGCAGDHIPRLTRSDCSTAVRRRPGDYHIVPDRQT